MNTLNLIQPNLRSPYEVWNESDNDYFFVTDHGVVYKISFGDDAPIWKSGAYTFDIQNTNQKASPSDQKVKMTIISIVEEFFRNNADILLYICETGDNKQAMRNRLFIRWFNEYSFQQDYILRTAMVKETLKATGACHFCTSKKKRDEHKSHPSLVNDTQWLEPNRAVSETTGGAECRQGGSCGGDDDAEDDLPEVLLHRSPPFFNRFRHHRCCRPREPARS